MNHNSFEESKAYQYAVDVLNGRFPTNKYIKAICKKFLYEIDHQEELLYYFDYEVADKIINIMKLINFANARCLYDTNLNRYVNKKKSTGKIDMVAALINALYLQEQEMLQEDFVVQVF